MTFWNDFKKFIDRGNVVDMAVGVVVGAAFSKIVSSLVADLITPFITLLTKASVLSEAYACLNPDGVAGTVFSHEAFPTVALAQEAGFVTMNYGLFLQTVLDFLVIAFSVFCVIRLLNRSKHRLEKLRRRALKKIAKGKPATLPPEPEAPAAPKESAEDILRDIRALLTAAAPNAAGESDHI